MQRKHSITIAVIEFDAHASGPVHSKKLFGSVRSGNRGKSPLIIRAGLATHLYFRTFRAPNGGFFSILSIFATIRPQPWPTKF